MELKKAIENIQKRFGKEAIAGEKVEVEFVNSGSLSLDIALGGGYPMGRIVEIYGAESSGKTTLALHLCAEVQKLGRKVGYIDMEQALDPYYAEQLGVKVDIGEPDSSFILSQPDDGETALEIAREFVKVEEIGCVVIDSVSALVPKAVIQGEAGDAKIGLTARLMSSMIPTLLASVKRSDCIVVFINQIRDKIGVFYGPSTTTSGGNALKFYASQRLEVSRAGQEKEGEEVIANRTRVKVVKNKVAPPFKKAEFSIEFGKGIDKFSEVIDMAVDFSIIQKSGSWYAYGPTKLGQGLANIKSLMQDNPELFEEVEKKLIETIGL